MATFADMGWFTGGFGNTIDDLPPLSTVTSFFFQSAAHSIMIPDGIYTVGQTISRPNNDFFRPFSGRLRDDDVVRFAGYEEGTGYPVFAFSNVFSQAAYVIVSDVARDGNYAPTGSFITDTAYDIGPQALGFVRFDNVGIREGTGAAGNYQFLGQIRDIPAGSYMVGDTEVGDTTLMLVDQNDDDQAVEFVGYQTDTNYPIFKDVDEDRYFLLADEPGQGTSYGLTAAEITTGAYTTCFAPGTLIATPGGERAVETLKPGDMVLTADGDMVPVKWLGFQKVSTLFGPGEQTLPVRIRAGALGRNTPHTDLVVTKDHGMIVDGVVCNAGALINGTSITEVPTAELGIGPKGVITWYHVETEGHVPLLANGAVAESFIDNVGRETFSNHAEFVAMYGADVPPMTEMETPRAMSMRQVPLRIRLRLARRADIILAPPGVRRLWAGCKGLVRCLFQERRLRDRLRLARYRLARGLNIA